jgi:DNA (cytosine-5)-methyltransferase 1
MKPIAYYNEIDPYAAQWLRNLIAAGHIAPGDVDERSIEDVKPDDLRNYTQCHFFAGIGVWSYALRNAGWPDDKPVWTGSCPCQPFSAAGKGGGFDDERHLWPHFHWLIGECRPQHVFGEQVASGNANAWFDLVQADLEAMDYAFGIVPFPSAGVGAPHIRDRAYWVANANGECWNGSGYRGASGRDEYSICCGVDWLANTECEQYKKCVSGCPEGISSETLGEAVKSTGLCLPIGMANTNNNRQQPGSRGGSSGKCTSEGNNDRRCSTTCGVADTHSGQQRQDAERIKRVGYVSARRIEGAAEVAGFCCNCWLANSVGKRSPIGIPKSEQREERQSREPNHCGGELHRGTGALAESSAMPTNGFWQSADWLFCRDEKWRPVRPGSFPLVDGATARVGRLRAYGNAINAEAAQAFIAAYMNAVRK